VGGAAGAQRVAVEALIARPRLVAKVRAALESGPVLVTAGPGFGKTTLLDQAVRGSSEAVAWIACTDAHRDPGRLLVALVEAIRRAMPGAADAFAERLAAAPGALDADAATDRLLAELGDLLVDPLFVVVDDAERLEGAADALRLVAKLVAAGIPLLRVAVATRRALDLRVAKLRAAGRLSELGAADLAFSAEESAELLGLLRGDPPNAADVDVVVSTAQGWPLGVALLGAIAQPGPGAGDPSSGGDGESRASLHAYLAEEILDSLEPELRRAVIESSVSDSVTPRVIGALELPEDLSESVERAGILVRRGSPQDGFSYHPLFREFLRARLEEETDAPSRASLHARLAPAIAAEGDPAEAIEHWLAAAAWEQVAQFLESNGPDLIRSSPGLVREWLERLPDDVRDDPGIRLLEGQLEWAGGNHPRAADLLWDAVEGLRRQGDPAREWMARFMIADSLGSLGDVDGATLAAEGFDEPDAAGGGPFGPATAITAAMVLAGFGRFEDSERIAARAQHHPHADAVANVEAIRRAFTDTALGDPVAAMERASAALSGSRRDDPFNVRLYVMSCVAVFYEERGDWDDAIAMWAEIEEVAGEALAPFLARENHDWRAKLHTRAGRLAEAEAELARGTPIERGWRGHVHHVARARIAAMRGEPAEVAEAADRAVESVRSGPILFRALVASDLIPPLARSGNRRAAWAILDDTMRLVEEALPSGGHVPRPGLMALRAWLRDGDGDRDGSDEDLQVAWGDAGPVRPYILRREWEQLRPLLTSAVERGALEGDDVVSAVRLAFPDGLALIGFMSHPVPEVRRAALEPAIASGHPEALRQLRELLDDDDPAVAAAAARAGERIAESPPPLHFRMLGGFSVRRGAWRIADEAWDRPTAARLVRFLLIHHGEVVPSDLIVEALWPKLTPDRARSSLHTAVSRARQALELPGATGRVLESLEGGYRLNLEQRDTVDTAEFETAAARALEEAGGDRQRLLERARSLWGGEPLPAERYTEWAIGWRERLFDRYVEVLTALAELHIERGEHAAAIGAARELVELDPLNEAGHRELMAAYARTGRTGHALRQYLECRRALVGELGIEPSQATSALQARILAGEAV
jgi:ATP/maltotriose-dependent transcriptional regulator MalT/DNA-binding SARP family transcriptional activator